MYKSQISNNHSDRDPGLNLWTSEIWEGYMKRFSHFTYYDVFLMQLRISEIII